MRFVLVSKSKASSEKPLIIILAKSFGDRLQEDITGFQLLEPEAPSSPISQSYDRFELVVPDPENEISDQRSAKKCVCVSFSC